MMKFLIAHHLQTFAFRVIVLTILFTSAARLAAAGAPPDDCANPVAGPDVIVGQLRSVKSWGRGATNQNNPDLPDNSIYSAFSVGTTSCNMGDAPLDWFDFNANHPVISQNIYRLREGRFEQLGQSWLKHGFAVLSDSLCCTCTLDEGDHLNPGCSDTYTAHLNGLQGGLGPRSEVNPVTGQFIYPPTGSPAGDPTLAGRVVVLNDDLDPALNAGALYFVESQYITPDDALAGNDDNNASYRSATVTGSGAPFDIAVTGTTQRSSPAIQAWQDADPSVVITAIDVPGDGRLILGTLVTNNMNGTWTYEYALHNFNSDRSVGSFLVPHATGLVLTDIGFHDVDSHSGEPYAVSDWPADATADDSIRWATDAHSVDPNANAIHWGTLYNFRFGTTVPPATHTVTIGLFKPGTPTNMSVSTLTPMLQLPDCNGNGVSDDQDIASGTSGDLNSNFIPDECEDCNINGIPDDFEIARGITPDCNANGVPDDCDVDPTDPDGNGRIHADCDHNGVPDECDPDCNANGIADGCDLDPADPDGDGKVSDDCNANDVPDECEADCDTNGVVDDCDVDPTDPDGNGKIAADCNATGIPDECELISDIIADVNSAGLVNVASTCGNGTLFGIAVPVGMSWFDAEAREPISLAVQFNVGIDCQPAGTVYQVTLNGQSAATFELVSPLCSCTVTTDEIVTLDIDPRLYVPGEINTLMITNSPGALGFAPNAAWGADVYARVLTTQDNDCNRNDIPDECDADCDADGTPDDCEMDCNANGVPDECDLAAGTSLDCNANGVPDQCDIDSHDPDDNGLISGDCNGNGTPDKCDLVGINYATFDITATDLLSTFPTCGGFLLTEGFSWMDSGSPSSADVMVEINVGIECDAPRTHLVILNEVVVSSFSVATKHCTCSATDGQLVTLVLDSSTYVHGGMNTLVITHGSSFSLTPNVAWGDGVYARATAFDNLDCDANGVPDTCDLADCRGDPACGDCNGNGGLDSCDIASGVSADANANGIPDECEVP